MGEIETKAYQDYPYGEPDTLARKILRGGGQRLFTDCYRYRGKIYWIVNGRVLDREQAAKLEDERRREGRIPDTRLSAEVRL